MLRPLLGSKALHQHLLEEEKVPVNQNQNVAIIGEESSDKEQSSSSKKPSSSDETAKKSDESKSQDDGTHGLQISEKPSMGVLNHSDEGN